jgi:hypothetical protein
MTQTTSSKKVLIILAFSFAGWALCGAAMGIGMALTSVENAMIIHAFAAPVIYFTLSWVYFSRWNYTSPFRTAAIFLSFVILMDFFIVALIINRSLEMFTSPLGTWIPFLLIYLTTYLTGIYINRKQEEAAIV